MQRRTATPAPTLTRVSYGIEEAATVMGLSTRTVYRLVWSGELRALRSGRRVLIPVAAIDDYLGALAQVATR
jgi:excisionase family DNA binding protein